jgi:hypothetical protein
MPPPKPMTEGIKASLPKEEDSSSAGIRRLQMEAATMTPEAKPVSPRCTERCIFPRMKNTQAAPRDVPRKGINNPQKISIFIISLLLRNFSIFCI